MASDLDNLQARRAAITAELAAMTSTSMGGKIDFSVDGQSESHVAYRLSLYQELELIDKQIASAEGPWENLGQAVS